MKDVRYFYSFLKALVLLGLMGLAAGCSASGSIEDMDLKISVAEQEEIRKTADYIHGEMITTDGVVTGTVANYVVNGVFLEISEPVVASGYTIEGAFQ